MTDLDSTYWDYSGVKANSNSQAYYQYPAMMVPRMQGDLIDRIKSVFPDTKRTFDPFAGSGTVLVESLKRDMSCVSSDINPMAILLCKVKSQPFKVKEVDEAFGMVQRKLRLAKSKSIEIEYGNRSKWFTEEALIELSRIKRLISRIDDIEVRRFMWVAFSEAVRIVCNSRTTTYKLHMRSPQDIEHRKQGTRGRILTAMSRVVELYKTNFNELSKAGCLVAGRFRKSATVLPHDIRTPLRGLRADVLISSPPYGDNHTTVTYGQHAFLPLLWIPFSDIDERLDDKLLANTHSIDSVSLGGRRLISSHSKNEVCLKSTTLQVLVNSDGLSNEAQTRLLVFFYDLFRGLASAVQVLRPGRPIVLTLGNRCVSGQRVKTDQITRELLESLGCTYVDQFSRAIPTKRMAHRNKSAQTMLTETLLVMRGPSR